tara:strand:- start:612 stop:1217 length:606 start_codon:yes stop_codon:yes gene_type:complete
MIVHHHSAVAVEEARCYVCLEDGTAAPLHRACACADGVHLHCLAHTVRSVPAHAERCGVCHARYPIVPAARAHVVLTAHVGMTCALGASGVLAADGVRLLVTEPRVSLTMYLVLLFVGDAAFFAFVWNVYRSVHGRWRWWSVRAVPVGRTLTLGGEAAQLDAAAARRRCRLHAGGCTCEVLLWCTKRRWTTPPSSSASPTT